ncbi:hypothetical protein, partial [Candidatus Liberibacter solanacearum]|uniref:hypothetical protein n=2 Tax=Candidatus Liberibacter solanacearum TaxID=556287 RepID=UPI00387DCF16
SQKLRDPTFFEGTEEQLAKTPFRMAESLISFALPDDYHSPFRHDPQTQGTVAGLIDQMSFLSAYIAPWNVGKYLGAGATAMKFVKAGGLVNMATSRGAESRRDYLQKGVDSNTDLKMGAIEGIGGNFFSILILYMILSFWGKPFLKAIYTRIIDTMNKML